MKKLISIILAALLAVTALTVCISADETSNTVGYSASRVVKPDNLSEVRNILDIDRYPDETAYKVNSADGLLRVASAVRQDFYDFADVTIYLTKDIDMTGKDWTPIGTSISLYFAGTFDGLGHIISNLVYENASDPGANVVTVTGLFGMTKGATLKNIVMDNTCSFKFTGNGNSDNRTGALIAWLGQGAKTETTIDNCYVAATVEGMKYTGGIVGQHDGNAGTQCNITNTTFAGSVSTIGSAGGFCGFLQGNVLIDNCLNTGNVTTTTKKVETFNAIGGIVGRARPKGTLASEYVIKNCVNTGKLTGGCVGGIVGGAEMEAPITVENCTNYGMLVGGNDLETTANLQGIIATYYSKQPVEKGNIDKAGQPSGITLPTFTPDYTSEDGPSAEEPDNGNDGSDNGNTGNNSGNNGSNNTPADTAADTTADTKAETKNDTTAAEETEAEKSGCGSALGLAIAPVALIAGGACILKKKNKED